MNEYRTGLQAGLQFQPRRYSRPTAEFRPAVTRVRWPEDQVTYDLTGEDYARRVYAGVLGKTIGVYLGRPFEGMLYRDILRTLGPIEYYVHERLKRDLIVTDDDLSGTFTFVRALQDHRVDARSLTPQQVGQTWLNYVIENKSIFWWGGLGLSTEHTAYLRLKQGIPAPSSGSMELNSKVVAEQIGAQIFIDAWAMVAPGQPDLAVELARKAASVSHDGEAIYAAQIVAAMESLAFVEPDLNTLLDTAVAFVPAGSLVRRMIDDLRGFHAGCPDDWERAMVEVLEASYGYDKYGGNCHAIPNHGVIILALLYGRDEFQRSLMIANTCGWDTDCNSGNVGCLLGIKNGLAGIDAGPDWRGPVADRLMLPTADGGSCITDAVREADRIVDIGRSIHALPPLARKGGARFHFSMPGSVQGFHEDDAADTRGVTTVTNRNGRLAISYTHVAPGRTARVATPTFAPQSRGVDVYNLIASPTVYSGQTIRASVLGIESTRGFASVGFYLRYYADGDTPALMRGPTTPLAADTPTDLSWTVPSTDGRPIYEVGFDITGEHGASGTLLVDFLTWDGPPNTLFGVPKPLGKVSGRQWVEGLDQFTCVYDGKNPRQVYFAIQNQGRGLASIGTREWTDYTASATLTPHLAQAAGLAVRVRGLRRYYALLLKHPGRIVLIKTFDGEDFTLADAPFAWDWNNEPHDVSLTVLGDRIRATVDGRPLFDVVDADPIVTGGVGLVIEEGRLISSAVRVSPV